MPGRIRAWFRNPLFLLAFAAGLAAFVVQSGELGSADTMHRLQTAHSFWTSEPAVFPNEYPEFGVHGRGGKLYDWYGIGQPLLMLPADVIGTYIERLPVFADYNGNDPSVRDIVVSYSTNILISVLTALVCFRLLRLLNFSTSQAVAGVLALLFCTTHLHYTQNMMENNYILLLTLTGFAFQYEWLRTGSRRSLLIGSAALGLNLLTRLTTGLDLLAAAAFLFLALWFERARGRGLRERLLVYVKTAVPVYAVFLLIDRLYQYYRFGSFFNTYVHYFALEHRLQDPSLPASYPFETPFRVGFLGALFAPEKSIFLFDPLLVLTIVIAVLGWKRFRPEIKAYLAAAFLLLLAYICFYAKYTVWSGDFAWGDRYVSTAAEMVAFFSVPLLLRYRVELGKFVWTMGAGADRGQRSDSTGITCLLVAARDLSDGNAGSSHLRSRLALQEYRRVCIGENGRVGTQQSRHDRRPVGLRAHHHLEFSAVCVAQGWRGAGVGSQDLLRVVDRWTGSPDWALWRLHQVLGARDSDAHALSIGTGAEARKSM